MKDFLEHGWKPDRADPLIQLAMQLVSSDMAEQKAIRIIQASQMAEHERLREELVATESNQQAQGIQSTGTASPEPVWKCSLCDCDSTLPVAKVVCQRGRVLSKLPDSSTRIMCNHCAVHMRKVMKRLGPNAPDPDIQAEIDLRKESGKSGIRQKNVMKLRENTTSTPSTSQPPPPKRAKTSGPENV